MVVARAEREWPSLEGCYINGGRVNKFGTIFLLNRRSVPEPENDEQGAAYYSDKLLPHKTEDFTARIIRLGGTEDWLVEVLKGNIIVCTLKKDELYFVDGGFSGPAKVEEGGWVSLDRFPLSQDEIIELRQAEEKGIKNPSKDDRSTYVRVDPLHKGEEAMLLALFDPQEPKEKKYRVFDLDGNLIVHQERKPLSQLS